MIIIINTSGKTAEGVKILFQGYGCFLDNKFSFSSSSHSPHFLRSLIGTSVVHDLFHFAAFIMLLLCFHSSNDVPPPPERQRNVSLATVRSSRYINAFYTGGLFYCYILDKSICHFRDVKSILTLLFYLDGKSC